MNGRGQGRSDQQEQNGRAQEQPVGLETHCLEHLSLPPLGMEALCTARRGRVTLP